MDINVARHVLRTAFRSSGELQQLLPVLQKSCAADQYQAYAKAIAAVLAEITLELTNRVVAEHPVLEAEVEAHFTEHGRFL